MIDNTPSGLQPLESTGWRTGLSNLMNAEFGAWWKTKEWWTQALLWTAVVNGSTAVAIWGDTPDGVAVFELYGVMTMFAAIAVAILMQESVVGEKRSGTAAWVHSKPVSRSAFILSKLAANAFGVLATMIIIPSLVFLIHLSVGGIPVSAPRLFLGASVAGLNLLFYLTLTLMLGTLFETPGPVIAIPLAVAFGQQMIIGVPGADHVLPWVLVVPTAADTSVVGAVISGRPVPAVGAVAFTAFACVTFTLVAFWKWYRTEL